VLLLVAFLVWNAVFDREVILSGRAYIDAAVRADGAASEPVLIASWMQPAVSHAFWLATIVSCGVAAVGAAGLAIGARIVRSRSSRSASPSPATQQEERTAPH
jgi:hypothetical protein